MISNERSAPGYGPRAICFAAFLAGCATQPTLNRWSKAEGVPAPSPPVLFVASAPGQSSDPLTIKGLPERAQAAYIAALAAKAKGPKDLAAAMAGKIAAPSSGTRDTTRISRVLMAGVQRPTFRPGDRLLTTTISIRPMGFRFTDYSLAATDRTVVNIGSVSVSDQRAASVSLVPGPAATAEGVAGSLSATRTETGTRNIVAGSELSVNVAPDEIRIYRTGAEGADLTGATLVKLALQLSDADTVEYALAKADLVEEDGKVKPPAKAKIETTFLAANPARDLYVCARLDYEDRTILEGEERYDEGRQRVALTPGHTAWTPYLIAPSQDIETPLWMIMSPEGAIQFDDGLRRVTLTFDDYDDARDLLFWLQKSKSQTLGAGRLSEGTIEVPLPIAAFDRLQVRRVDQTRGSSRAPDCAKIPD